ncbi:hypothetical protein I8748_34380 [Nostoc sp. CENA67]|uniref:Uncharacterized protein n=1 Tax=Amazonocrinis nigriterrae CENA67 TaxID=2794033 RepID=A0A8J7I327_9NOST|nr:hypothetical protein [Amazonocrinis nigriterrae]MBH8567179.1 hypothetical protein [Amazonocrinis nigriterrae CENA67]
MPTQMMSDLLADLSTEQQQLLAGGIKPGDEEGTDEQGEDRGDEGTPWVGGRGVRLYRIRSRSLVRVQRIS